MAVTRFPSSWAVEMPVHPGQDRVRTIGDVRLRCSAGLHHGGDERRRNAVAGDVGKQDAPKRPASAGKEVVRNAPCSRRRSGSPAAAGGRSRPCAKIGGDVMEQRNGDGCRSEQDGAVLTIAPDPADGKLQQEDGHPDDRHREMHGQHAGGRARGNVENRPHRPRRPGESVRSAGIRENGRRRR